MLVVGQNKTEINNPDALQSRMLPPFSLSVATSSLYTISTNVAVARGPAGKYLVVTGLVGSPYISAQLYDDATDAYTALTISGAMGAASNQSDLTLYLTYSDEQGKYYLKCSGEKKVYPLTLSGTTLTIGVAIDLTAAFAGATGTIIMTGDRTDLWFIDTAGVVKVYDLSGASMSTAKAVPSLTGIDTTDTKYWKLFYDGANLWFFAAASASASAKIGKIQKYNIAGNSWSTITTPGALSMVWPTAAENQWQYLQILIDPTVSTYWYILTQSMLWKYTVATGALEMVYTIGYMNSGTITQQYNIKLTAAAAQKYEACDYSRAFAFFPSSTYSINPLKFLATDSTLWTTINGAGYIEGFQALATSAPAGAPDLTDNVIFLYKIDGGAAQQSYNPTKKIQSQNSKKIYFATSFSIVGFWCYSVNSGGPNQIISYHLNS